MRIRFRNLLAILALMVSCGLCPAAEAATNVRELPAAPELQSTVGTDYALRTVPFGGATVTLVDVHAGGDWVRPEIARLPPPPASSGLAKKDAVQWFYASGAGWMAVPLGWRVQRAVIGADGGTQYVFTASEGRSAGWVSYEVIPVCVGCVLGDANGLLPNAGEQLAALGTPAADLGQTNPVMSWQSRPDDCTLLFRYRTAGLTVHAVVQSSVAIAPGDHAQKGALALAEVYAALPAARAATAEFMVSSFRQAFPACRSPNGWSG